jgi:hypothetical protein
VIKKRQPPKRKRNKGIGGGLAEFRPFLRDFGSFYSDLRDLRDLSVRKTIFSKVADALSSISPRAAKACAD